MHKMLGIALKGIPRDSYRLMSKVTTRPGVDPQEKIDELRKLANTDYFDIMLMHYQHVATWPADTARWQMEFPRPGEEGRHRPRRFGTRSAGVAPVSGQPVLQIAMIRMNHKGSHMDAEDFATGGPGNVNEVVEHTRQVHQQGMGVISMKLVGEGSFITREDRQAAMKFAFNNAGVDSVTVVTRAPPRSTRRLRI